MHHFSENIIARQKDNSFLFRMFNFSIYRILINLEVRYEFFAL